MDFKEFARYVSILGMIVLLAGGALFLYGHTTANRLTDDLNTYVVDDVGHRNRMGGGYYVSPSDSHLAGRDQRKIEIARVARFKEWGMYVAIAGTIVLFLGFALNRSALPAAGKREAVE